MDNHPIPQDVTGFQFKLIGEMTLKQFAYVATGAVFGGLFYLFPIPLFIKLPLAFLSTLLGISFAFLPISGRPMDVMVLHFIRALLKPTQFVYQKTGVVLFPKTPLQTPPVHNPTVPNPITKAKQEINQTTATPIEHKENYKTQILPAQITRSQIPSSAHILSLHSAPQEALSQEKPIKEAENIEEKALAIEKELQSAKTQEEKGTAPHQRVLELEKELQTVLLQKEQLAKEITSLKQTLNTQKAWQFGPKQVQRVPIKDVGIPMSLGNPNLVTGVIKDPRGNPLPNILVEIKDQEGNPVRAFKTNGLGQFASATPLANGTYQIVFEDPKGEQRFNGIEFTAKGDIIAPIGITSVDQREELRRDLFGSKQQNQ